MNILVATCYTPFTHDRNVRLARELSAEFSRRGHQSDAVLLPRHPHTDLASQSLALRLLDLTESAGNPVDRLVTLGEPAMALRHPHQIAWSVDITRPASEPFFGTARRAFYASLLDAKRRYTGLPLYPPLADTSGLEPGETEPVYLWAGTLASAGRASHALEAMRFVSRSLRLTMLISDEPSAPDTASALDALRQRVAEWSLTDRIEFVLRPTPAQRRERLRHCLGLLALHHDQPAPEEVVIEALHARRPVLTFDDTAAAAGLIENGLNGVKQPPDPRLLALDMNRLAADPAWNRQLGEGAFASLARHGITWSHVAERLLS